MKTQKLLLVSAALALVAGCSKNNPQPVQQVQVPMVQMCGMDPQTGQQDCILVPQNQMAQANQQGYYQYNNGQYRDNSGNLIAAAVVAAGAAYMMNKALSDSDRYRYEQDRQQFRQRYHEERAYDNRYDRARPQAQQSYVSNPVANNAPAAPQPAKPFVPTSGRDGVTYKAPTGGLMAGHGDIALKDTRGNPAAPAAAAAPNFKPTPAPNVPMVKPMPAAAPQSAPTQFTPASVRQTYTPASQPFTPAAAPRQAPKPFQPSAATAPRQAFTPMATPKPFKPAAQSYRPVSAPSTSKPFKPSSARSSTKK